ncbi:tetratricopeptide repeat protein [Erythrobacter sp. F6033]|uniref:tetratricopeptide repeat protein n=1 Tax=Erythrobacter sp. F6033 TaxID=2926401 RepID=UPI001FF6E3D5|nr:tetratricopeptide repeat protein [Erythrobacter sp. F6033]MCK0127432.1 tetratricopeptide repeat protein [Erythrobacter sp. F6033]
MNTVKIVALVLAVWIAAPAIGQEQASQAVDTAQSDDVTQLVQENQELRNQAAIADLRADLLAEQSSWFEIWTAVLMGGFSLVVTVVIIYFAFKFGSQAVEEAKTAAVSAATAALDAEQKDVRKLLDDAKSAVAEIRKDQKSIKEYTEGLVAGQAPADEEQRKSLRDIAREALAKPRRERSIDEYRALITVAFMDKDWQAMERRAIAMEALFEGESSDKDMMFAAFNRAYALGELGRNEEAIAAYDAVMDRFGESEDSALQEQVAIALFNKGASLGALNRSKEAIAVYDAVMDRYSESDDPALQKQVAMALSNKGVRLGALNRSEEEFSVYDAVVDRFGESDDPALQEEVAIALFNKGASLGALNRSKEAIAVYDAVVDRFGESDDPALQRKVAIALSNKGVRLGALNRSKEAIAVYDAVMDRYGENDDPTLQKQVAMALVNKGVVLTTLNRSEEAVAVYDVVVDRFGESDDPAPLEHVAMALFNKACAFALQDKVTATIEALTHWRDHSGSLDCEKIANDTDFDKIRDRPTFRKFLKDNGCDPDAKSDAGPNPD